MKPARHKTKDEQQPVYIEIRFENELECNVRKFNITNDLLVMLNDATGGRPLRHGRFASVPLEKYFLLASYWISLRDSINVFFLWQTSTLIRPPPPPPIHPSTHSSPLHAALTIIKTNVQVANEPS